MQSVKAEVNGITELAHLERTKNSRIREVPHTFSLGDRKSIKQKWTEFLLISTGYEPL
jgi:prolyl-tRNA synthetase